MTEDLQIAGSSDDFRVNVSDEDITVNVYGDDLEIVLDKSPMAVNGRDGVGVASGGSTGDVLTKKSGVDYDTQWSAPQIGVPYDGLPGQILQKLSALPLDTAWVDVPPSVPAGGATGYVLAKASDINYDLEWIEAINPTLFVLKSGSTMTGPLVLSGDPATALGAATKQYVDLKAPLDSPVFTGNPQVPNPPPGDNDASIASTQFVQQTVGLYLPLTGGTLTNYLTLHDDPTSILHAATKRYVDNADVLKASLNSPVFTGDPQAPTPLTADNDQSIATTAFVKNVAALYLPLVGGTLTGGLVVNSIDGILIDTTGLGSLAPLAIKASPGFSSYVDFASTTRRWRIGKNSAAETGANAGSNFIFEAFDDAGNSLSHVFTVARNTRILNFNVSPTVPTVTPATDSSLKVASTAFVQAAIIAAGTAGGVYLALAGGTMTGPLTLAADPTLPLHAATMQYVDLKAPLANPVFTGDPQAPTQAIGDNDQSIATTAFVKNVSALYLPLTGGTLTGALSITSGNLTVSAGTLIIDHTGKGTDSDFFLQGDNDTSALMRMRTGALDRWRIGKDDATELGGDTGSDFIIKSYNDAGTINYSVLNIPRLTQVAAFAKTPTAPTAAPGANDTQLATTAFVNTKAGDYLPLAGGTLTNFLTLHADPTALLHAATKQYVDNKAFLPLTGGTLTGTLNLTTGNVSVNGGIVYVNRIGDAAEAAFWMDSDAGIGAAILLRANALSRWKFGKIGTAESGANVGSDFYFQAFSDAGAHLSFPILITRATGIVTFAASPVAPTPTVGDNTTKLATTAFITSAINTNNALYLPLTGGTLSGDLTLSAGNFQVLGGSGFINRAGDAANAAFYIASDVGNSSFLVFRTETLNRWQIIKNSVVETGSDAGSNFAITAFSDAGASLGDAINITRATRIVNFPVSPIYTGTALTAGDSSTKLATTAFVTTADNLKANLAGATFTGALGISTAGESNIFDRSASGFGAFILLATGLTNRWRIGKNPTAESGSDAGADFTFTSFTDAGSTKAHTAIISRATGIWAFAQTPTAPTATAGDSSTKLATTAFVATAVAAATVGGVPAGGTVDQVLAKASATDYDLKWANPAGAGTFLALTGGTMTGKLTLDPADQTATDDAATRGYAASLITGLATLADPVFTGDPKAPTPATSDNDTSVATTAFVKNVAASYLPLAGGVLTGFLTLSADPAANMHPVTLQYLTTQLGLYLPKSGGTLTGALVLAADPSADMHPVTRQYLVAQLALKASLASATFTGEVIVPAPSFPAHAANKGYVDGAVDTIGSGLFLKLTGGALTGPLLLGGDPTSNLNPVTLQYLVAQLAPKAPLADPVFTGNPRLTTHPAAGDADTSLASTKWVSDYFLKLSGGAISGALSVGGMLTLSSTDPSLNDHATRKAWVDAQIATRVTPATMNAALALKADLTGAAFTGAISTTSTVTAVGSIVTTGGNIQVTRTGSVAEMYITSDASLGAFTYYRSGANNRWRIGKHQSPAESGGDTGGYFGLLGYQDAGTAFTVFTVRRDAPEKGVVNFGFSPKAPTPAPGDNSTQLATTAFVVAAVAGGGSFLPSTGGTLTGDLLMAAGKFVDLNAAPIDDNHATNKLYVDTQLDLKANLAGGNTFTGAQTFSNSATFNVEAILPDIAISYPTAQRHATHKYYVDNQIATRATPAYVDAQDALKASLTGAIFTGNVTSEGYLQVNPPSGPAALWITSVANQTEHITFRVGANNRWRIQKASNAEGGTADGADLTLEAYNNAGVSLGSVFTVTRSSRVFGFAVSPTVPTPAEEYASTRVVNTLWVASYFLRLGGGTMTGGLILNPAAQTSGNHAATKQYVLDQIGGVGGYLPLTGGVMGGDINMNGHDITNVDDITFLTSPGHTLDMSGNTITDVANLNMSATLGNIVFPAGAAGNIVMGGTARVSNSGPPAAVTDAMRQRDYMKERPEGNYNFSEPKYDKTLSAPIEGWDNGITGDGGVFGKYRMIVNAGVVALENEFHPVDPESYYECTARIMTNSFSGTFINIGVQCYSETFSYLGNRYVAVENWNGIEPNWQHVGAVIQGEGTHPRWNFPVGTRYIKRIVYPTGSGAASIDFIKFRKLGEGEQISSRMFGMRPGSGHGTWNSYMLETLLWYLVSMGGVAFIEHGTFDLNLPVACDRLEPPPGFSALSGTKSFTLAGQGRTTILKRTQAGSGDSLIYFANTTTPFTLRDFEYDANSAPLTPGGAASTAREGYQFGATIEIDGPVSDVTLRNLRLIYGSFTSAMLHIGGGGSAGSPNRNIVCDGVYLDGKNEASNGILILWPEDCAMRNCYAINVRSTIYKNYWFNDPDEGFILRGASSPCMALQYKHGGSRNTMDNVTAINCRNGVAFTGDNTFFTNPRLTGATIQLGAGSAYGMIVSDAVAGNFTGITINGGDALAESPSDCEPGTGSSTPAWMAAPVGFGFGGECVNSFAEISLRNFNTSGDQNWPSVFPEVPTGATPPATRGLLISGDSHYNHVYVSSIGDMGLRPILFDGNCWENMVTFGSIDNEYDLRTDYALDGTPVTYMNYMRYMRETDFQLKTYGT